MLRALTSLVTAVGVLSGCEASLSRPLAGKNAPPAIAPAAASPAPSAETTESAFFCGPGTPRCKVRVELCDTQTQRCVPVSEREPTHQYKACDSSIDCAGGAACCEHGGDFECVPRDSPAGQCSLERCSMESACPAGQQCVSSSCQSTAKRTTCGDTVCMDIPDSAVTHGDSPGRRDCVRQYDKATCLRASSHDYTEAETEAVMGAIGSAPDPRAMNPRHPDVGVYACTTPTDCGPGFTCCALSDAIFTRCQLRCPGREAPVCTTDADCAAFGASGAGAAKCVAAPTGMPGLRYCALSRFPGANR